MEYEYVAMYSCCECDDLLEVRTRHPEQHAGTSEVIRTTGTPDRCDSNARAERVAAAEPFDEPRDAVAAAGWLRYEVQGGPDGPTSASGSRTYYVRNDLALCAACAPRASRIAARYALLGFTLKRH